MKFFGGFMYQFTLKSYCFLIFCDEKIKEIQTQLNIRPRKHFEYENPIFVFEKLFFNPEVTLVALI